MSEENVSVIRTLLEAFRRRDQDVINALLSPDIEWDATRVAFVPELAGVYRGMEGTRTLWGGWLSPWRAFKFDYELRDAEDEVVSLISNQRQWGRHSGIETVVPPYAWLYTVQDGKVVRATFYGDHQSALEAAGLEE